MVETEGTVQVSNPSPLPISAFSWVAGAAAALPAAACAPAAITACVDFAPIAAADGWPAVPDADGPPPMVALARIPRIRVSFVPEVAVTRTPGPGTSTWITWLVASAAAAAPGRTACFGRAALPLESTTADGGTLAGLTGWMSSASVWPKACAGQFWALPGVPR